MGYIWGTGIVNWVRSNDGDRDNVCYLCGQKWNKVIIMLTVVRMIGIIPKWNTRSHVPLAFTIFQSMDNLRWYYPYYTVKPGETSRASVGYRRTPVNDKSMLAWWLSFTPTTYKPSPLSRRNAESKQEFTGNQMSSDRFEYLRRLYISINRDQNHDITSHEYQNVKHSI